MELFGAGPKPADAAAPLILETDAGTVAIVAMGEDFGELARVSPEHAGMVSMREDRIRSAYFSAKAAGADYVIAYLHWGDNYQPVNRQQKGWAKTFAAVGYDLVVGHGSHVVQPISSVDGMPVVYSLGNFAFGSPGRWETYKADGFGLLTTLSLGDQASLEVRCIVTDNARVRYQPRECSPAEARQVFAEASPDLTVVDGIGTMPLPSFTQTG